MPNLVEGDPAPDFTLPRDGGATVSPGELHGRHVVLYFYPKDDTTGCTAEALAFTALMPSFEAEGAVVIGVSPDTVARHDRFAAKHGLSDRQSVGEGKGGAVRVDPGGRRDI